MFAIVFETLKEIIAPEGDYYRHICQFGKKAGYWNAHIRCQLGNKFLKNVQMSLSINYPSGN